MEKIYVTRPDACELMQAGEATIDRILGYSRSLHILGYRGMQFETSLN